MPNSNAAKHLIDVKGNDEELHVDDFFYEALSSFNLGYNENIAFITVNHIVPTLPYYLRALSRTGTIAAIIPKSASDKLTRDYIEEKKYNIEPITKGMLLEDPQVGVDLILKLNHQYRGTKKFVIIDIGGYFSPCLGLISKHELLKDLVLGFVEDTENGLQKYLEYAIKAKNQQNTETLSLSINFSEISSLMASIHNQEPQIKPIVSVARDKIKDTEDVNVGLSIVRAADTILRVGAHTILERMHTVGIIGFGKIGKSIGDCLKQHNIRRVIVYDIQEDVSRVAASRPYDFETVNATSRDKMLAECDMIFCATGNKALHGADFNKLKHNVFISSCTSADDELDLSWIEKNSLECLSARTDEITTFILPTGNHVHMMRRGEATNFAFNAVNGPGIYAVQAAMIIAANQLSLGKFKFFESIHSKENHNYHEISDISREQLSKIWLRIIEQRSLVTPRHWGFNPNKRINFSFSRFDELSSILLSNINQNHEKEGNIHVIYGMPGMGKTYLARKALLELRAYKRLFFRASTAALLLDDYAKFAHDIGLDSGLAPRTEVKRKVKEYLERQGNFIIIYDDAIPLIELESFLPNYGNTIVITTKYKDNSTALLYEVPLVELSEAHEYIIKNINRWSHMDEHTQFDIASRIAAIIGTSPINLLLVCNYINTTALSIENFIKIADKKMADIINNYGENHVTIMLLDMFFDFEITHLDSPVRANSPSTSSHVTMDRHPQAFMTTINERNAILMARLVYYYPSRITLESPGKNELLNALERFLFIEKSHDGSFHLHDCVQRSLQDLYDNHHMAKLTLSMLMRHVGDYIYENFYNHDFTSESNIDKSLLSNVICILEHAINRQMYDDAIDFIINNEDYFKEFTAWDEFIAIINKCYNDYTTHVRSQSSSVDVSSSVTAASLEELLSTTSTAPTYYTRSDERILLMRLQEVSVLFYQESYESFTQKLGDIKRDIDERFFVNKSNYHALMANACYLSAAINRQRRHSLTSKTRKNPELATLAETYYHQSISDVEESLGHFNKIDSTCFSLIDSKKGGAYHVNILHAKILYNYAALLVERHQKPNIASHEHAKTASEAIQKAIDHSQTALTIFDGCEPRHYRRMFIRYAKALLIKVKIDDAIHSFNSHSSKPHIDSIRICRTNYIKIIKVLETRQEFMLSSQDFRTRMRFCYTLGEIYLELAKLPRSSSHDLNQAVTWFNEAKMIADSLHMRNEKDVIENLLAQANHLQRSAASVTQALPSTTTLFSQPPRHSNLSDSHVSMAIQTDTDRQTMMPSSSSSGHYRTRS